MAVLTAADATVTAQSAPAPAGAEVVAAAMQELCYFLQSTTVNATVNAQSTLSQRLSQRPGNVLKAHTLVKSRRPLDIRL